MMSTDTRTVLKSTTGMLAIVLATLATAPAAAQTSSTSPTAPDTARESAADGPAQLEDVVVTARKREESLNTVPLAISAFSANQIAARGLADLRDFSTFTPGFNFQNQSPANRNDRTVNTLTFRGLFLNSDLLVNAGGLLFVDGAPVIGNQVPPVADIERVEVLKGPQSAFFGRSTFSGAVSYVTKDPPADFSARASGSVDTFGSNSESVSIGGPIIGDSLRARLTFSREYRAGQWKNAGEYGQRLGQQETRSYSGTILWLPTSNLRIKAAGTYFTNDDGPPAQAAFKQAELNCNLGGRLGKYYCGKLPTADQINPALISGNYSLDPYSARYTIGNANNYPTIFRPDFITHGGLRRQAVQASLRIDYTLGDYTLSSVTAYHRDKVGSLQDLAYRDGRNVANPFFPAVANTVSYQRWFLEYQTQVNDFSQELRLTSPEDHRFRWMIGGNYFRANQYSSDLYGVSSSGPLFASTFVRFHPTTPAVFGAAYFDILSALTFSGELRYQIDKVRQDILATSAGVLLNPSRKLAANFNSVSPRATLEYRFADRSLIYGLWSRGYRPGGFNPLLDPSVSSPAVITAATAAAPGAAFAYQQEQLDNYEIGFKARVLDGRMQVNLDAYIDDYTRGQVAQSITFTPTGTTTISQANIIRNTGAIKLKGVEGELTLQATRQLQLSASGAYNYSRVKSGFCSDCGGINNTTSLAGKTLIFAPRYTFTLGGEYTGQVSGGFEWFARSDYAWRSKRFVDQANVAYLGSKETLNLRLGIRNDRFSAEIFCVNCTDDLTLASATYASADVFTIGLGTRQEIRYGLPDRRAVGVRTGVNF